MRIVLLGSGRGSNAEAILLAQQAGASGSARVAAIFSDVADAGILALGPRFGVPASFVDPAPFRTKLEGEGEARFIAAVSAAAPDLVVLAGFMRVLKPGFLGAFAGRIINLHPSLLPSFPGLDAIGQALAQRASRSPGCTVHYVTADVDGGPDPRPGRRADRPRRDPRVARRARCTRPSTPSFPRSSPACSGLTPWSSGRRGWRSPPDAAGPVETVLLEAGVVGWTLLEDAIAKTGLDRRHFPESRRVRVASGPRFARSCRRRPWRAPCRAGCPTRTGRTATGSTSRPGPSAGSTGSPSGSGRRFRLPEGHPALWLDPGMAFGTGQPRDDPPLHRAAGGVRGRAARAAPGGLRSVDAGCGSGILALSAALLGFGDVIGFDVDPEAVRVSFENAELNGMSGLARFSTAGLPEGLSGSPARRPPGEHPGRHPHSALPPSWRRPSRPGASWS